jgi:hypothetical protein
MICWAERDERVSACDWAPAGCGWVIGETLQVRHLHLLLTWRNYQMNLFYDFFSFLLIGISEILAVGSN